MISSASTSVMALYECFAAEPYGGNVAAVVVSDNARSTRWI